MEPLLVPVTEPALDENAPAPVEPVEPPARLLFLVASQLGTVLTFIILVTVRDLIWEEGLNRTWLDHVLASRCSLSAPRATKTGGL